MALWRWPARREAERTPVPLTPQTNDLVSRLDALTYKLGEEVDRLERVNERMGTEGQR